MTTFDDLLQSVGFPAASAANATELANRKMGLSLADIARQGNLTREKTLSTQEGNGVLNSGETGQKMADDAIAQAAKEGDVRLTNAQDIYGIQANAEQARQQANATRWGLWQQQQQFNAQNDLARQQLGQTQTYNDQVLAQQAQLNAAANKQQFTLADWVHGLGM